MGGDVVLALLVEIRERDDWLAALPERIDGGGHFGELGDTSAFHPAEIEVQRGDARIIASLADRLDQVTEQRLARHLSQGVGEGALDRVARELLDDRALRRNHQGRVGGDERDRMREGGPEATEEREQQYEMQDLAQGVEATPQPAEQSSQCAQNVWTGSASPGATPRLRPSLRCSLPCRRDRAGSRALRGARCRGASR